MKEMKAEGMEQLVEAERGNVEKWVAAVGELNEGVPYMAQLLGENLRLKESNEELG